MVILEAQPKGLKWKIKGLESPFLGSGILDFPFQTLENKDPGPGFQILS